MDPNPLEKDIESKVCNFAKSLGILQYKFTSPSKRSVPDRIFFLPKGEGCFLIEFKRAGKESTPAQQLEQEKLRKQGYNVYVCDNVEHGKRVVGIEFYGLGKQDLLEGY